MERGGPTSYKRLNDYQDDWEESINQSFPSEDSLVTRRGVQASMGKESRTYPPSRAKGGTSSNEGPTLRPKDFQERQGRSHYEGQGQKNFQSGLSP